jgi:hypothetical protein
MHTPQLSHKIGMCTTAWAAAMSYHGVVEGQSCTTVNVSGGGIPTHSGHIQTKDVETSGSIRRVHANLVQHPQRTLRRVGPTPMARNATTMHEYTQR